MLDWPVKKRAETRLTHVDNNNLTSFTILNHTYQYCAGFKITECRCNHKNINSTILVYMIINGKVSQMVVV